MSERTRKPEQPVGPEVNPKTTWRAVVERYLEMRRREGAAHATMTKKIVHADVTFTVMADKQISEVTAQDVIESCRFHERQDMLISAQSVRVLCSQVFRFAIAHGQAQYDAAAPTRDAIAKPRAGGHPGITDPKRVGELMRAIRAYDGNPSTRSGLLLSAYLFPRSGEIRRIEWSQIDGDLWTVPAAIMKKKREHLVPLLRQVQEVLAFQKQITGANSLVLQSRASNTGLISENTFNKALRLLGFPKTEHVHHGFRITASTNLHESGWNSGWIEAQLAHVQENKITGVYNKALYMKDRAKMMQWYADWLDEQERLASV